MYEMKKLDYDYNLLEPYYNKEMFYYHYFVLYKKYTENLNNVIKDLNSNNLKNIKCLEEKLSFNANAYILHSLFFDNLTIDADSTSLDSNLMNHIKKDFNSYDEFINILNESIMNIQGPGWVVFGYNKYLDRLLIIQVENHMDQILVDFIPLLVIDVWEHSYYLQYKTNKEEYKNNLFHILDFNKVSQRYEKIYII